MLSFLFFFPASIVLSRKIKKRNIMKRLNVNGVANQFPRRFVLLGIAKKNKIENIAG